MRLRLLAGALVLGLFAAISTLASVWAGPSPPPIKVVSNLTLVLDDSVVFPYNATTSDTVQLSGQLHLVSIVTLRDGVVNDVKLLANMSGLSGEGLAGQSYVGGGSSDIRFVPSPPPIMPADLGSVLGTAQLDSFVFRLQPSPPPIDVLAPGGPPIIPGPPPIRPISVHLNLAFDAAGVLTDSTNISLVEIQDPFGD